MVNNKYEIEIKFNYNIHNPKNVIVLTVSTNNTPWYIIQFYKNENVFVSDNVFVSPHFEKFKNFLLEEEYVILYPKSIKEKLVKNFYTFQLTTKSLLMAI